MLEIEIKTIKDREQRYNTVGDYHSNDNGTQKIIVSDMGNEKYELLIALHELVESALCRDRGISIKDIDDFDFKYEQQRQPGDLVSEPGDQPNSPYYREHMFATKIEKMMAEELNVDWEAYSKACQKLTKE